MYAQAANLDPLEPAALTGQSDSHVVTVTDPDCRLHPAAAAALLRMRAAAAGVGIDLTPVSSFRSFDQQLRIWNDKFCGRRPLLSRTGVPMDALLLDDHSRVSAILLWSALPGASRHHWGSDFDVIDRNALPAGEPVELLSEEYATGGRYEPLDRWLALNAADFGFFRPYDLDRGGVQPEPWHLSFAPLAALALPALGVELLGAALAGAELEGGKTVSERLPELHARYVLAVADAPQRALQAKALQD